MGKDLLQIDWSKANRHYLLDCQISKVRKQRCNRLYDFERENIAQIIKTKSVTELINFCKDIAHISHYKKYRR